MTIGKYLIRACLFPFAFVTFIHTASAQNLGSNLIVNGDAEKGPAGTVTTLATRSPGGPSAERSMYFPIM